MSRVGNQPITLPNGVSVSVNNDTITTSGPKGNLTQSKLPKINLAISNDQVVISRDSEELKTKAAHGLMRALVNNMVVGVSRGYERKLELNGVGYRVSVQGSELKFNLGFSHEVTYSVPNDIQISVDQNIITVSGINKQQVGQAAAEIRALKKPEPYKGKGIKYIDEKIIRKSGKSGKEAA